VTESSATLPEAKDNTKRTTFWRRCRRMGVSCLVVIILLLISGYWFVLSPTRVAHLARVELERITGADVTIGAARLDLSGIIHLRDVTLRARGIEGAGAEVFSTDDIVLVCDRPTLWRGQVKPVAIRMRQPTLTLAERVNADGQSINDGQPAFNWMYLRPPDTKIEHEQWPDLPRVDVESVLLQYGEIRGSRFVRKGRMELRAQVRPDDHQPGLFHLAMSELDGMAPRADGLRIKGSIDVNAAVAQARVEGLGLHPRYHALLPSVARQVWANVQPTGKVPQVQLAYDPVEQWRAEVQFDDVAMLLPELPGAEKRFRMEKVKGAIRFEPRGIRIDEANPLVGEVEGLSYTIKGTFHGYRADSRFEIGLHTQPFELPAEHRAIYAMPAPIQDVFRMLTPSGKLSRVTMKVWREAGVEGEAGKVQYQGTAAITEARALYARFPYELQHCRGRVSFTADEFRVLGMVGKTPSGGAATIKGSITTSLHAPAVDLEIVAIDVPLDQQLYDALHALRPEYRPALDLFFNKPAYQRMADEGHFMSAEQYNKLELEARALDRRIAKLDPLLDQRQVEQLKAERVALDQKLDDFSPRIFDLGGRANMVIKIKRKGTVEANSTATADIDLLDGTGIVFEHFPYPLRIQYGKLKIGAGLLALQRVKATGLQGAKFALTGTVRLPNDDDDGGLVLVSPHELPKPEPVDTDKVFEDVWPELKLKADGIAIDELLLDALPQPQDRWVRDLNATGTLNVDGRIFRDEDAPAPDIDLTITLANAQASPGDGGMALKEMAGTIRVSLNHVQFENVSGVLGDRKVHFTGMASWSQRSQVIDLRAEAEGMQFSDSMMDLIRPYVTIDPSWHAFIEKRKPEGVFDAKLAFRQTGTDQREAIVELRPKSISFLSDDKRVSVTDADGVVYVRPGQVRFDTLKGKLGGASFSIDGGLTLGQDRVADFKMTAEGKQISDELLAALPSGVRSIVDAMGIEGGFEADLRRVRLTPGAKDGKLVQAIAGTITATNAKADLGVALENINAVVELAVMAVDGRKHPKVEAKLNAKEFSLRGRPITGVTATMSTLGDSRILELKNLRGRMYEGVVAGDGRLWLDKKRFEFRLALGDVQLQTFLNKGAKRRPDEVEMTGDLTASFNVEGSWADKGKVRGRGEIQVRDGKMYELPLALGLLHVTHLSLPTTDSFERADVSYYIKDGRVVFEKIALESPHMRMAGDGSMLIKDETLDITLTSSNPSGLDLGPMTDLVDAVRNQLVTVRVTGTLNSPKREIRQFDGLTKAWEDVFGKEPAPN